ncbi:MAG TPA: EamA family transporter [Alphaproteobacteria bacterium]|nr:EamA family transporter [Alphaproteobacteria bacterium]HAJ48391.1 EamA family transporter [Alphaproteobacteria bacterium]
MPARDLAFMMLINAIWGLAMIPASVALQHFPPLEFTALRFLLLSLVLAPVFLRWRPGQMRMVFLAALTGGTLNFALLFLGVAMAGEVGPVAIAGQLGVPFTTILSIFILGEVVRWRRWSGIALAFAGVTVIGFDPRVLSYWDGFLVVVASAFVGAVSSIVMRQIRDVPVFQLQAWIATLSWPMLLVMSLAFESQHWDKIVTAPSSAWTGVLYTALMSSLVAHAGFYWMLQRYEVSKITPLTTLAPLFTVLFAIAILGEPLTWRFAIGAAITLLGVWIITLREPEKIRGPAIQ